VGVGSGGGGGAVSCAIVTPWPAIVSRAVRGSPLLRSIASGTVPLPLPLALRTWTHGSVLVAVQAQPLAVVTSTDTVV
jgi:hypothetical protein